MTTLKEYKAIMKTLYIEPNKEIWDDCVFRLIDKDNPPEGFKGISLNEHFCSNSSFAFFDLVKSQPAIIKECNDKYGDFEVNQYGKIVGTFLKDEN